MAGTRGDGLVLAGPFTTTFNAPAACASAVSAPLNRFIERDRTCTSGTRYWVTTCYPPMLNNAAVTADGPIVYSPATACPSGYASVWDTTSTNVQTLRCCPASYTYYHSAFAASASCSSRISLVGSSPIGVLGCSSTTFAAVSSLNTSNTDILNAWARVIQLETPVTVSSTQPSSSSSSSSSLSSSSSPAASPTEAPNPPPSIPAGAIAGIVIGAVAFLALIIAGLFICLRKRKQRMAQEQHVSGTANYVHPGPGQSTMGSGPGEMKYAPSAVPTQYNPGPEKGGYIPPNQAGTQHPHAYGSPSFVPVPHNNYNPTHTTHPPDIMSSPQPVYGSPGSDRNSAMLPPYTMPQQQGYSKGPPLSPHNQGNAQAYPHVGTAQAGPTELDTTAAPSHQVSSLPFHATTQPVREA